MSIVTPTYNAEKYIRRTLDSVISQTWQDWELIAVDDCSTDGTLDVLQAYASRDSRIKIVALEKNCGAPARPRNLGVKASEADWIALLDADDIWHPDKLASQFAALERHDALFCSTRLKDFTDDTTLEFSDATDCPIEQISFLKQLIKYRTPASSVVLKRNLLVNWPFNEDPAFKAREDLDCFLRIHEHIGHSIKLSFPFLCYRIVPGQISGAKWRMAARTHMVLKQYRQKDGRALGWKVYLFSLSNLVLSVYFRLIRKTL